MSDMQVQAELVLEDKLSRPAGEALEGLEKSARRAGDAIDGTGRKDGAKRLAREAGDAARAMGAVAGESRQAQDAIDGAARRASHLAAAFRGARSQLRGAAEQLGRLKAGLDGGLQGLAAAGGAGFAFKAAMDKPVQYEKLVASMANVAFADRGVDGRVAGMKELDAAIVKAVRQGGGTREQGAGALNAMLASGAVDESTAKDVLLPVVMKASTASGASAEELSQILVKGISQKQFTADQAQAAIDKAVKAGEAGQFELKDMAKWLPQIISAGKGQKGMEGFEAHLANLQAIAQVTGTNDQAGNAYFNLLGKITSTDAANNFKKKGINLAGALAKAKISGVDPVTAFVDLIQTQVVGKNRGFKALQKKIAATKDKGERQKLMEQALEILQGSAIGEIIQDREALLGLVGVMNGQATIKEVLEQLKKADGAVDTSFGVMSRTTDFQQERLANEKDIAVTGFFEAIKEPFDRLLGYAADLAQKNPALAVGAAGAGTAATSYMAASGASALFGWLRGWPGGKTAAAQPAMQAAAQAAASATPAASAAPEAAARAGKGASQAGSPASQAGKGSAAAKLAGRAGGMVAAAGAAFDAISTEMDDSLTRAQKNEAHAKTAGGFAGAMAGAKAGAVGGAAIGSFVGPLGTAIGTAIGGALGGAAGYFGGSWIGKKVGGFLFGQDDETGAPQDLSPKEPEAGAVRKPDLEVAIKPVVDALQNQAINATFNIELALDGDVIARKVEEVQTRQAARR